MFDVLAATLKYLTFGSSGVEGLKMSLQYVVVRLAYAGESMMERRRVVNDEGRLESVNVVFEDVGGGSTLPEDEGRDDSVLSFSEGEELLLLVCTFPMPMLAFKYLETFINIR